MATVYLAQDLRHDRKVAIKVLRPELAAVIGAERFLREIKTIANLQHPHILGLIDSGEVEGTAYYVMPFVEGESLRDRLMREKQLPIADAVRLAGEIAAALDYAHRHGIIHRDIKPENVLLHDDSALVADFGIALAVSAAGGTRMTETGMSLGTPHYMSPEQAMGEREITGRSDVYALGVVLYEMLVGEPPFTGPTAQAIVARVVTEQPRSLTAQRHTIPAHVEAAVLTALEKLPADRWPSAPDFARALQVQGDVVRASAAPHQPVRRPLVGVLIGGGLGLALLAGWALGRSKAPAPVPVRRWSLVLPDSAPLDYFAPSVFGEGQPALAISRSGDRIAYVARRGGTCLLYYRRLDESVSHPLAGTEGAAQPFFSPDGEWIGFFAGGELKKVALAGGDPVVITRVRAPRGGEWTTDGRIVFAELDAFPLASVPAAGGTPSAILPASRHRPFWPSLLPGGEWVLGSSQNRRLVLWSLKNRRGLAIGPAGLAPLESADTASLLTGSYPRYVPSGHLLYLVGNTLMTLPFDAKGLRVTGPATPVMQAVRRESWSGGGQYDVAADGTLLFASGSDAGRSVPVWVDRAGRVRDSLPVPPGDYYNIFVSGTGRRVALSSYQPTGEQTLSILDVERGLLQEVNVGAAMRFGAWWPGGTGAVITLRPEQDGGSVWRIPVDGAGPRDSLFGRGWVVMDVSPDSAFITIRSFGDTSGAFVMSRDGKTRDFLGADVYWTVFSPNGRWVAMSTPEGLKVAGLPFTGRTQTVAPATADEPEWSPRGDELFYREGSRWMAMTVSKAGGSLTVDKPRLLFQGRYLNVRDKSYDVGPDGRFLLLLGPPEEATRYLDVVTGFAGELGRLAPRSDR